MKRIALAAAAAFITIAAPAAFAQAYPAKPVKIIVPFAAGGGPDVEARRMAPKIAEALGGAVVVAADLNEAGAKATAKADARDAKLANANAKAPASAASSVKPAASAASASR